MQKFLRTLTLMALLVVPWVTQAQETLTVYDGTATNSNIPFYGLYADTYGAASECVIPAEQLGDMEGGTITAMTFYLQQSAAAAWTGTHQVYLGEVAETTLSGITGPGSFTVVKTGSFDATGTELTVTFDEPYTYEGGNLLIGTYVSVAGNWKSAKFYGVSQTGTTARSRTSSSGSATAQSFLPKTTFTYEAAATGCDMPTSIASSNITPTGATIAWEGTGSTFNLRYKASTDADYTIVENVTSPYTFTNLTANTAYTVGVQTVCSGSTSSFKSTSFTTANPCAAPTGLSFPNIGQTSATITWTAGYQETQWTFKYKKSSETEYLEQTVSGTPSITLTGLDPLTTYNVQVYNCENYVSGNFNTAAGIPMNEAFATTTIPNGWTRYNVLLSTVMNGGSLGNVASTGWNFNTGNGVFDNHAKFNLYGTNCKYWLVTPTLPMEDNVQLTFDMALTAYSGTLAAPATTGTDDRFVVLITTDGGTTWAILRQWDNAGSEYVLNDIACSATGQSVAIDLSSYAGQSIAIAFYGESTVSNADNNLHIDNVSVDYIPACPAPTALSGQASGYDATVTWQSSASEWQVAYSDDNTANPDDNIDGTVTEASYTKEGLPLGDHYFWVRALCGDEGGNSTWAGPVSVYVGYCVPNPTSHDGQGITGVSFGMGDYVVENGGEGSSIPATSPYYGDYSSMIGAVQAGVESTIAITTSTGNYPYTFVIWVDFDNNMSFDDSEVLYVGKAASGAGTVNATITVPATQATGDYRMRIYGADSYFTSFYNNGDINWDADHDPCVSGSYRHAHDYTLRVLEAPSCLTPTDIQIAYTGGTTAEVSWTSEATAWNLDVNGTVTAITENPYTLTGLNLATTYAVKVQANCGGSNGTSEWSNPVSFTTDLCMPADQCEINYSLTDQYNDSWNGASVNVIDAVTESVVETFTMPNGAGPYEGSFSVCDGREIQFQFVSGSYPNECGFVITDVNDEVIYSKETATSLAAGIFATYTVSCAISNCKTPTNVAASEVGPHSAVLSWTENGEATAWVVAYKADADADFTTVNASATSFTLTGLAPETNYTVKVRPVCEDQAIKWSAEQTFTTTVACPAPTALAQDGGFTPENGGTYSANLTWTGFATSYAVVATPTEGDAINLTATTNSATLTGLTLGETYSVSVTADCGTDGTSNPATMSLYVGYCTPNPTSIDGNGVTNITFGTVIVSNEDIEMSTNPYYYDHSSVFGTTYPGAEVAVSMNYATNYAYYTWVWVDWNKDLVFSEDEKVYTATSTISSGLLEFTFDVPQNTTLGDYRMRIQGKDGSTNNPCYNGSYSFLVDYTLRVDDVPTCMPVASVNVSNVTSTSATLTWEDTENEATYTIYNMADNSVVADGINALTYDLTGLTPNVSYTFAVEANCLGADGSKVNASFTTLQTPAAMPYTATFDNADDNSQWTMVNGNNGWYIGTAANNGGEQGLYISNDNGTTNAYSIGNASVSYAYRTVNFTEAGWYNMAFDWMANGESTWDYLRVALVPVNAAMPASYVHNYYNTLPEGWIALDGGSKLNSSSDWNNANNAFQLTTAGQYNLVIMWSNDGSGGSNPPAAVDNIAITGKVAFEPVDLTAEIVNGNTATLTWTRDTRNNNAERYTIKEGETVLVQNLNANTYTINNVEANVDHNYTVFAVNQGENSDAATMGLGIYPFPTEPGKMVCVAGTILNTTGLDAEVTLYRGLGENLTVQNSYDGSTYLTANLTNYTASNEWPVYGPMTVAFVGENATAANTGVANLTATTVCPAYIATPATVYDNANGAYTWTTPQGTVYNYENHRTAALAQNENGDIVATYSDTVRNAGDCDSIYNTLQLTLHPDFTIAVTDQFCEGTTYTVGEGDEAHTYTASAQENVLLHTVNGADSVIVLNLQMNPAPVAYINNKANDVMNNFCNGFDLVLNARSNMEGVTFQWDDETTGATRTVNPQGSAYYTLNAIDPTTGCQSIAPATLAVNTIPVPALTISGDNEVCYGQSATLTVSDANNVDAAYRWSNNQTTTTVTVTPTTTTTYTVTATSTTGNCVVTAEKTVTVNALPVVEVSTDVDALCANSTLTLNATAVEGYTYEWNTGATTAQTTTNPTVNGNYTVTVTDGNGCVNQFTTNNVTVYPVYELNDVQSVCFTQNPYTWGEVTIAENGNYDQTFQTVNGCDSLVHLTFTFEEMSVSNTYREVCKGVEVLWGEETTVAQESTTLSYVDNTGECPEQRNLVLTVNPVKASSFDLTACDSYLWPVSNVSYDQSGSYSYTLQTVNGCDSVVTMNLTVNYQNTGVDVQTACDQFVWNLDGVTYTESTNEPVVTLEGANVFGCDSVVTLNLTVNYKSTYIDEQRECDAMTFTWIDGQSYNLSVVPDDNVTYTLDETNAAGCDSIAILSLTMNYVTDTLIWVDVESCDSWYIDTVDCYGTIGRKYVDQSGDVVARTRNAATGRDQISRIHLTINHSEYQTVIPQPTCVPWTWTVAEGIEHEIVSDTILSQELQTESGCQLIKVLRFTAKYPTTNTTEVTLCQNGSWTDGNNVVYNMSDYQLGENEPVLWNTTTNVAGCDSTDYVVFTVNPVYTNLTANLTYCESEFTNGQLTYVNPNDAAQTVALTIPAAGLNQQVYTNTIVANWTTAQGCDSSVTITYTVNPSVIEDVTVQNCYNYTWNGREYNTLGETVDTFETVSALTGCDSTAILYLTLTDTVIGEVVTEVCGEFTYEGEMYREDTTFRVESGVAISGCDSVTMMVFNVTPRVLRDVYVNTNIPYKWANGTTYTGSVDNIYYDATVPDGCDSILVLHLNWVNDTVVICENEVPYSGNGITINNVTVNIEEGFENGMPDGWTLVDNDGDGHNWQDYLLSYGEHYYMPHTGERNASSASYINEYGALHTDNWMIMPRIFANQSTVLSWYSRVHQDDYPDSYTVMVSTTGNAPADFTDVVFNANSENTNYTLNTVDLSSYAGQNIYVAFRHNDYDMYWLFIDDVNLKGSSVYHSGDVFNDTILYYVVNRNTVKTTEVTACDTYTWEENNQTYTESGEYSITGLTNANGCDSTHTLALTVNYSSSTNATETVCDSYTWSVNGHTYTESGLYTYETTNAYGCEHNDTLNLTINVNPGVKDTVVACDSYDWNGQTYTNGGDYSVSFEDANGCTADSMLHLTVNVSTDSNLLLIVDAASTYYNGNYYVDILEREGEDYNMPYTFDENVGPNSNGCDSINHVTLYVTRGIVHDENYNNCGNFTWERNNHTYTWINAEERAANGNAAYKDITDPAAPVYIHAGENPTVIIRNNIGVAEATYVLWLNMVEANYMTIDLGTILMSQHTDSTLAVGNDSLDARTLDLRSYYVAKQGEPNFSDTIHHTSTYYCENVVTYTANLVWNYDTLDNVYVCNDVNSYEWTIGNDTFNETLTGDTTTFTETFAAGTANEVVKTISVIRNAAIVVENDTVTACDEYTWHGTNYTSTPATAPTYTYQVVHNGATCDSVVTLYLTINHSNTGDTTAVACDSFNWYEHTNIAASVDTLTHVFANANAVGCDSTVTLHLTINSNAGSETPIVQCDSYTWNVENYVFNETSQTWEMGDYISNTYTGAEESGTKTVQYTDANGCVGTATLNLTINVNNGIDTTVASCLAYTWTIQSRDEVYGTMQDITNNYEGASDSGVKTQLFNDVNGCEGTATLHLTIYDTVNTASVDTVYGSGYTFHGHFYTPALNGGDSTYVVIYDTVDAHNCAIKDTMTLHVSQYVYFYTNKVECGSYTWTAAENGNGHTYRALTAEERAANPTAAYFDVNTNAAVPNMQQHVTQGRIDVLNLTLNTPVYTEILDTVPMSQLAADSTYTVNGRTISCAAAVLAGQTMVITKEFSMDAEHLGPFTACDSIVRYKVTVLYNYVTDAPDTVCAATNYEVVAGDVRNVTIGSNTFTYTLNAGQPTEEVHTLVVVNNAYTTNPVAQTVTECDSYTWTAGNGTNYTTSGTYTWNDAANCVTETLNLTINNSNAATDPHVACDTYTWINGTTYTVSNNTDTVMLTNVAGCDSVVTLNLTVNYSNAATDPHVACDTYTWINGTTYTASNNTDTVMRTNVAGCDSVVTLNLTINVSTTGIDSVNACDSVQWNNNWYYASNNTATKTISNVAGCDSVVTLNLTVNYTQYTAEEYWFSEGSYRYTGIHTAATGHMYMPGDYTVIETIAGAAEGGCDIIDTITLHVGNYLTKTEAYRSCNSYTWERNGVTYVRLTDAESEANPTALYKTEDGAMVYANPTDTVLVADNYDSIYMLELTLDAIITVDTTIEFPVSMGTLTFAGQTYGPFISNNEEGRLFAGDTLTDEIHLTAIQYCDSIINLTIHVNNSYVAVDTVDVCYTESSYTWNNQTIDLAGDPDNANTYYIYNTVGDEVQYLTVNQHAIQYTTERRTECDSYNWNGTVFTESTSGATMTLPDQYGCDSTVTLTLTINHNTSTVTGSETNPVVVCDGYEWTLGNGTTLPEKVNESGMHTYDYATAEGCESHDTLYLTVNHSNSIELDVANCGAYTWTGVGTYTTSGTYAHTFEGANAAGCDSTVTLNLTVYEIPATVYDTPDNHVCDTFFWTGLTWNGTEMVDTVFDTITETAYSLTAYAYNENGCPIEHFISAIFIDKSNGHTDAVACDSYVWSANGETYTESGEYEYTAETENACGSLASTLSLTINKNSGHADVVAICNSNLPAGGYEWHDNYYSATGEYYYNYSDDNQCASTDTLKLTVGNVRTFARIDTTYCGPFTWDITGETFEESTNVSYIMTGANAGGCDSVVYLYLTIYEQPVVAATDVICDNALENYSWRGINIDAAGEYTDFGGAANEYCDSLYTLTLTVNERTYSSTDITACDSYEWNGNVYTQSGSYTYTTNNSVDCDSVATLVLTINKNSGHAIVEAVCDSYEWNNQTYTESGEYYFNYTDGNNCASIDTLMLTVANSENNTVNEVACDSYVWEAGNGETYDQSGTYTHEYTTGDGCNGMLTLNLTINYSNSGEQSEEVCDSYEWNGETYTETGVYNYTTTNVAGCDSVVTLNLTVNNSTEGEETVTACNFYTWNGVTFTQSGDYTYTTNNSIGCDSVTTLHLTINSSASVVLNVEACDNYNWNGANYTQTGTYTYAATSQNGCDSIVTLNLTILSSTTAIVEATACDTYEWTAGNGQTYTESGNYTYTTTAANGCDSVVTLALTINPATSETVTMVACGSYEWNDETYSQSGTYTYQTTNVNGCDSVATLNLTINNGSEGSVTATACDSYVWNGETYNQSGTYTYNTVNAVGCDSVATLNLTINVSTSSSEIVASCGNYEWNGETYNQTGLYTYQTTNAAGCDSVATLSLVINQSITSTENATACDSYVWHDETYTESGVYTFTSTTEEGCDNIATLLLTIKNSTNNAETVTVCNGYTWNNTEYATSGDYTYSYTNAAGCVSTDTLHLTVNASTEETVNATVCDSYTWNGQTYTQSGTYNYNTVNAAGCDSVATLNLTVNYATTGTETVEACNSYTWNGTAYNQTGVYTYQTTNAAGCDSVATLVLMIKLPYTTTVNQTACDSYTWTGATNANYTASGNYSYTYTAANGCDSVVTLALTINQSTTNSFSESICLGSAYSWNGQSYQTAGQYEQTLTARNGCDSVVTLNLTVLQPQNTTDAQSACEAFTWSINGQTYTQSGNYTANITDVNGCPATTTLTLTVNQPLNTEETVSSCQSYQWNNTLYTESGTYTSTFTDVNNCSATATLNLTINPATSEVLTVAACDSYTWIVGDSIIGVYTETPGYQLAYSTTNENGCPHAVYLLLTVNNSVTVDTAITAVGSYTWHGNTYTESGTYSYTGTGSNGCDSTTVLTLTVQPAITYYTVTLLSANSGMGTVSEGGVVAEGTLFTAEAFANNGYAFVGWTNAAGETVSNDASYTFTVTSDVTLTAQFEYIPVYYLVDAHSYVVTVNNDTLVDPDNFSIMGVGEYESGATVTLTAVADSGYHFVCWSNGRNTATITFTVTGNIELIAYFEQDPVTPPTAVEDVDMSDVVIYSVDTKIIVRGVEGNDVYVFDVNGRMLDRRQNAADEVEFRMANTGVYLIKVGNAPAKRVLVVR